MVIEIKILLVSIITGLYMLTISKEFEDSTIISNIVVIIAIDIIMNLHIFQDLSCI